MRQSQAQYLSSDSFSELFVRFNKSVERLQARGAYSIGAEDDEFRQFLEGRPLPPTNSDPWIDQMVAATKAGKRWVNVHVLPLEMTPYLRYLIEWGYVYWSDWGADIRFVYAKDWPQIPGNDFYVIDGELVVAMDYTDAGGFLGARIIESVDEKVHMISEWNRLLASSITMRQFLATIRASANQIA